MRKKRNESMRSERRVENVSEVALIDNDGLSRVVRLSLLLCWSTPTVDDRLDAVRSDSSLSASGTHLYKDDVSVVAAESSITEL